MRPGRLTLRGEVTGLVRDLAAAAEKQGLPHSDEGTPVPRVPLHPAYRPSTSWTGVPAAGPPRFPRRTGASAGVHTCGSTRWPR